MANLNKVLLIGRLTRDPECRYTQSGAAVTSFGMATNRKFKSNGESKEEVCFIDVVTFGKLAEIVSKYAQKGKEIFLEGRLTLSSWKSKEGENRSKMQVTAENIQLLGNGGNSKNNESEENPPF